MLRSGDRYAGMHRVSLLHRGGQLILAVDWSPNFPALGETTPRGTASLRRRPDRGRPGRRRGIVDRIMDEIVGVRERSDHQKCFAHPLRSGV